MPQLRLVPRPPGDRGRLITGLPVAIDAMGGDRAPSEIVAGAREAAEAGVPVVLVGPIDGSLGDTGGLEVLPASEVIAMDEDAGRSVRTKRDSSLVRAAEAVRDGRASAMVSAGNTGATMASALLRMGRLKGVARPCIATPLPTVSGSSAILVDAGANSECQAEWLVQFAQMGAAFFVERYGTASLPKVALLSIGEEPTKGNALVKATHALLVDVAEAGGAFEFVGNVEGRDLLAGTVDVVVTDGFTGNVALKALEGALTTFMAILGDVFSSSPEAKQAAEVLWPSLAGHAERLDPEMTGGAMLLGVGGVCIISHGSSSSRAILNAAKVAHELAERGLADKLAAAVRPGPARVEA
ncbi:MAG: phosphate acyltransferase PlsX [Acidimicrobiales bacterium]